MLPVSPEETEVIFTFAFEGRIETLRLNYTTGAEVISPDCGAFLNYKDLTVAETTFELFNVVNNNLLINATVNLEIRID